MEDLVWKVVRTLTESASDPAPRGSVYTTQVVLAVGLWAILHDRPFCWACRAENWPSTRRPSSLPHPSTLSRRWRSRAIVTALRRLHRMTVQAAGSPGRTVAIDGRSLLVGGASKDPDAKPGRAVGGMGRGYKLHAMIDAKGVVVCFDVRSLNVAEQSVAKKLLTLAPRAVKRVVGDAIYDSVRVHRAARAKGRKLYTRLRQGRVGARQQPERLRVLRVLRTGAGRRLLHWRDSIERAFGRMSNLGFGLKGLPPWSRRLHRATAWITGKIIFYNAYIVLKQRSKA